MDQKIPFTSYDFWAYLSAGFLLLFVVDHVSGSEFLARDSWTVVQGVIAVSAAYVVGHLLAGISAPIFEELLVGCILGDPKTVLFGQTPPKAPKWLLPGYYEALPIETQEAVRERGRASKIGEAGKALYWLAYDHARATPAVMSRLDTFLNLYGFCRNIALVAFIAAVLLAGSYWLAAAPGKNLYWAIGALFIGLGMFLRYLKFYRHYAVEVFTAFAHSTKAQDEGDK